MVPSGGATLRTILNSFSLRHTPRMVSNMDPRILGAFNAHEMVFHGGAFLNFVTYYKYTEGGNRKLKSEDWMSAS